MHARLALRGFLGDLADGLTLLAQILRAVALDKDETRQILTEQAFRKYGFRKIVGRGGLRETHPDFRPSPGRVEAAGCPATSPPTPNEERLREPAQALATSTDRTLRHLPDSADHGFARARENHPLDQRTPITLRNALGC